MPTISATRSRRKPAPRLMLVTKGDGIYDIMRGKDRIGTVTREDCYSVGPNGAVRYAKFVAVTTTGVVATSAGSAFAAAALAVMRSIGRVVASSRLRRGRLFQGKLRMVEG